MAAATNWLFTLGLHMHSFARDTSTKTKQIKCNIEKYN